MQNSDKNNLLNETNVIILPPGSQQEDEDQGVQVSKNK